MTQGTKIALAATIAIIIVVGGVYLLQQFSNNEVPENSIQQTGLKTYSGDFFTFQYPNNYTVSTDTAGVVTISGDNGKIMVGNFEPTVAPVPTSDMTQEQIDEFPKDTKYHGYEGNIASGIFYKTGDDATKQELEAIQASIEVK
ncbi:MAG: hypothetical protein P1P90_02200 [Patescibacteria group bacterium]|nr:hypothetical protein [Patescibacteria group bacterium]